MDAIVDQVKQRADIVEIVGMSVDLKKTGKDYFGVCPFHADSDPSFSVVPAKRMFHCFGCGAQGDVIEFWSRIHGVRFWDALKAVAALAGVPVQGSWRRVDYKKYPEASGRSAGWTPKENAEPGDLWRQKAAKFVHWGFDNIFEQPEVLAYLASRGIREETIVGHGLGWCEKKGGGDVYRSRESWGLPAVCGNNGRKKALWLPRGLIIPFFDETGDVVKLRIRRAGELKLFPGLRYYFVPGGVNVTTVLNPDRPAHVVVESDLDAYLVAQEAGDLVGTLCLGSSAAKPDRRAAAVLRQSHHILNALDFDGAGAKAWQWWKREFPESVRWPVPRGKDPGEAYQAGVDIRKWIMAGLPPAMTI